VKSSEAHDELEDALRHHRGGRLALAERGYRVVLAREAENADAGHLLGMLLAQTGREEEGLALLRRAVELDPQAPHFHGNLGNVLARMGRIEEAAECFRAALRLKEDYAEARQNLGVALERLGRLPEALVELERVVALRPGYAEAHQHRGNVLRKMGRLAEAMAAHQRAIALRADYAEAHHGLAAVYSEQGRAPEAAECYRQYLRLRPQSAPVHSDLLHTLHYLVESTPAMLFEEAKRWAAIHAEPLTQAARGRDEKAIEATGERKLRVGFVAADFREHPIARLMVPVLSYLDRAQFAATCYSDTTHMDACTQRLRKLADGWRETAGLSDAAMAELIRRDAIDILVDLGGHMGGNRLTMFARRPARVQVTHFNYPDTTGMSAMDWRITDAISEPEGESDRYSTEKLFRLPECAWCYDAGEDVPEVGPLPAISRGYVTFVSLNKPLKHSAPAVELWCRILHAVPGSRLLLMGTDANPLNPALREPFARHGITGNRLIFAPRLSRARYLSLYNEADIALDPFPYNGGVTSCDAMWMGVPLITLAGATYHSRQGLMLLENMGLQELIAQDAGRYMARAVELARELDRVAELRSRLRELMRHSRVCNGEAFARQLGQAFREMCVRQ
jgi:predicted O-linked N-acetylglucosamine transferase (SPINDLY family)